MKMRILCLTQTDGEFTRSSWKLQKRFLFWWRTVHWTSISETVASWVKQYPDIEIAGEMNLP